MALYCTLSVIATQIRASHRNHLHTDQCPALRDDAPVITADLFIWSQQGDGDTAVWQLCLHDHSTRKATSNYTGLCDTGDLQQSRRFFTVFLKPKTRNPFFSTPPHIWGSSVYCTLLCWCYSYECTLSCLLFLVVSLNKLCYTDEARCGRSFPQHSCTVAPLTLVLCNVLQDDPPLLWAIPTGAHLLQKLLVQDRVCLKYGEAALNK